MDDLAVGSPYIVVASVQLDKACRGQHAVNIVVKAAELLNNAVLNLGLGLIGIDNGRIYHLAVVVELVHARGEEAVGYGHPIAPAVDDLAVGGPYIVVIITKLDKACRGQHVVDIVVKASVLFDDAVLYEHHAIIVKVVVAGCYGRAVLKGESVGSGDPVAAARYELTAD